MAADAPATEILQRLLRVPPAEFVAERNRVAKALKADGDKDLAVAVSVVRRPGVSDWALDVAAADHADEVAELVEAAAEVIDAQEAAMEGRDGGDLRIRLKLLRVCTASVATLANAIAERSGLTGSGSSVTDITTRLTEIAGNRPALDLLHRGLLGAEDPGVADPFGIAGASDASEPATAQGKAKGGTKAKKTADTPSVKAPPGPSPEERKRQREQAAQAEKALAAAEKAADTARRAATKHEAALAKAEGRVADAEARLELTRAEVAVATDELRSARDDLESADREVESARAAMTATR